MNGLENYFESYNFFKLFLLKSNNISAEKCLLHFGKFLLLSKPFSIPKDVTKLLVLTKNTIGFRRLPFPTIFLDAKIELNTLEIFGILLVAFREENTEEGIISNDPTFEYNAIKAFCFARTKKEYGKEQVISLDTGIVSKNEPHISCEPVIAKDEEITLDDCDRLDANEISKAMKIFTMNFLDLLNNPEVEIVPIIHNENSNLKRERQGKRRIPIRNFVVVKGKIKDYIEHLKTNKHFELSYRFWVRGHFRTYRDEKYKLSKNTTQWIMPYIKGQGILINKNYQVKT